MVRTGLLGPVDDAFLELLRLGALVSLDRVLLADGLAELVLRGVLLDLGLRLLGLLVVVLLIVGLLVVVLGLVVVLLGVVLLVVVLRLVVILLVAGLFPGLENGVDRRAHLAQLRVEGVAGAVGLTQVTVSDEVRLRRLRDSVDRELPGDRRGHSIAGLLRRGRTVVGAQHGDAEGAGVVSGHVSADDGLRDVAAARLPETTVLVRDDVVADIVPAASLLVVRLDTADDARNVFGRVAVRTGGVVHDGLLDPAGVVRAALVGLRAPGAARTDLRLRDLLRHGRDRRRSRHVVLIGHRRTVGGRNVLGGGRLGVGGLIRRRVISAFGGFRTLLVEVDGRVLGHRLSITGVTLRVDEHELGIARRGIAEDAHLHARSVRHRHRLGSLVLGLFLLLLVEGVPASPFGTVLDADLNADIGLRFGEGEADEARIVRRHVEDVRDQRDVDTVLGLLLDRAGDVLIVLGLRLLRGVLLTFALSILGLLGVLGLLVSALLVLIGRLLRLGRRRLLRGLGLVGSGRQPGRDVLCRAGRRRSGGSGIDDIGRFRLGQRSLGLEDVRQIGCRALVGGSGGGFTGFAGTGRLESVLADFQRFLGHLRRRRGRESRRCRDR